VSSDFFLDMIFICDITGHNDYMIGDHTMKSLINKPSYRPWAQKRNFAKSRFMVMQAQLKKTDEEGILTMSEIVRLRMALYHIGAILKDWNYENKASKRNFGKR
jgi:hypothetical protein